LRKAQFNEIDTFIQANNYNSAMTFTVGHNKFSDWTNAEYKRLFDFKAGAEPKITSVFNSTLSLASVNWVTTGAI
jgi:hypothetical protein